MKSEEGEAEAEAADEVPTTVTKKPKREEGGNEA